ncbi:hypothetical protein QJQ58_15700 [Paenibacillus dendritiformis]|uniref:hypothetical protein n=1 Tax=Paenibacillus dendritiformis TaxID=130049 RepID=UPI00248B8328|nr:hypothetical protein [Paenibacillus dendritiformis]WGU92056.1 hypothetical protein QJQ58_15700 [Paenibacillus dendritiformis]
MNIEKGKQDESIALNFTQLSTMMLREVNKYLNSDTSFRPRKYSRENIRKYLENPETYERQLREASQYLYSSSSHYFRICNYFSKMLTLDSYLVPVGFDINKINPDTFMKNYEKALKYIENYNIKHEFRKILDIMTIEDAYFGFEVRVGDSFGLFRLPANYCAITGIEDGAYTFKFNMEFFYDKRLLSSFPEDFEKMYSKYLSTGEKWQEVDSSKGVCFKIREDLVFPLPPFSGAFEEILDLDDKKVMIKKKDKLDNFKMLHQEIPFKKDPKKSDDFLIDLPSVQTFHNNIRASVPEDVVVVTTPMPITDISLERKRNSFRDNAAEAEEAVFVSAGVSSGLFGNEKSNSVTVNKGIVVDASIMYSALRQFERFFKKRLSFVTAKGYQFKLTFLDTTYYNQFEKVKEYTNLGQYGLPKTFLAASVGSTVSEIDALNYLENNQLNLIENMKPLVSAHTGGKSEGAPQKDELTPNGEKTKVNKIL